MLATDAFRVLRAPSGVAWFILARHDGNGQLDCTRVRRCTDPATPPSLADLDAQLFHSFARYAGGMHGFCLVWAPDSLSAVYTYRRAYNRRRAA